MWKNLTCIFVLSTALFFVSCSSKQNNKYFEIDLINQIRIKVYELDKTNQIQILEKELKFLLDDIQFSKIESDETFNYLKQYVDQNLTKQMSQEYFNLYDKRIKILKERQVTSAANYQNQKYVVYTAGATDYAANALQNQAKVVGSTSARNLIGDGKQFEFDKARIAKTAGSGLAAFAMTRRLASAQPSLRVAMATMETSTAAVETFQDAHRLVLLEDERFEKEVEAITLEYEQKKNSTLNWMDTVFKESRFKDVDSHILRNSDLDEYYNVLDIKDPVSRLRNMELLEDAIKSLPQFHLEKARSEIVAKRSDDAKKTLDDYFSNYNPVTYSNRFLRESIRIQASLDNNPQSKLKLIERLLSMTGSNSTDRMYAAQIYLELGMPTMAVEIARDLFSAGEYQDMSALILAKNSDLDGDYRMLKSAAEYNKYYELLLALFSERGESSLTFLDDFNEVDRRNLVVEDTIRVKLSEHWEPYLATDQVQFIAINSDEKVTLEGDLSKSKAGNYVVSFGTDIFGDDALSNSDEIQVLVKGLPTTFNFKVFFKTTEIEGEGKLFGLRKKMKLNRENTFNVVEICSMEKCLIKA